jgi:hypothetical protein
LVIKSKLGYAGTEHIGFMFLLLIGRYFQTADEDFV